MAESQVPSVEYRVKAVFLYNFTQFVQWPAKAFTTSESPIVIGIIGNDPLGSYLDETVRNEKIDRHPLVVQRFEKIDEIKNCHILFVNLTDKKQLEEVFEKLKNQNTLTVGDAENFSRNGGMITFITDDNKIRIQINLAVAKKAELNISAKLLRLAEIVKSQNQ